MSTAPSGLRKVGRLLSPLLYLLPLAYLLSPVLWAPLDLRFYSFFQSKRQAPEWRDVVVVGIDERTRSELFRPPAFPLGSHAVEHAAVVSALDQAGARAIVLDFMLSEDILPAPPPELIESVRASGRTYLVGVIQEAKKSTGAGVVITRTRSMPNPRLLEASRGAYYTEVRVDPDGVLRRYSGERRDSLEPLPCALTGRSASGTTPILFPSVARPLPSVSYRDVVRGEPAALEAVRNRIAFVGLTEDFTDFVAVPSPQRLTTGEIVQGLPGVVALAAITETLTRGAPVRDVPFTGVLLWNVAWCAVAALAIPRTKPWREAVVLGALVAAAVLATAALHVYAGRVLPSGLLAGCLLLTGSHALVSSHMETTQRLRAEEVENERVRKEMETARRTQESLLPRTLPEVPGLDVWGTNIPSLEVSGDYYDVIDMGPNAPLVLVIADVSGKGLPAALIMSYVHATLRALLHQGSLDLAAHMRTLNALMCEHSASKKFVTVFIVAVEKATRRLTFVSAGHNPALLVARNGQVRQLHTGGTIVGMVPDLRFEMGEEQMQPGDVLCLYTDGITEARNAREEQYEEERLSEVLVRTRRSSAQEIGAALTDSVREFVGATPQTDDVTVVVLRSLA